MLDQHCINFLFKRQQVVIGELRGIGSEIDATPNDLFEPYSDTSSFGYRTKVNSAAGIKLPGPAEADGGLCNLNINERFSFSERKPVYYRYELWWCRSISLESPRDEQLVELIAQLRRSVRFDHDTGADRATHPLYHWHPMGAAEMRVPTICMTPRKTALFAMHFFAPNDFSSLIGKAEFAADCNAIKNCFRRDYPA